MSETYSYVQGRVWAVCDRCARKRDHATLKKEWSGLLVCGDCWDPKPYYLNPVWIDPQEGAPVKDPRPRPSDVNLDDASPVDPSTFGDHQ